MVGNNARAPDVFSQIRPVINKKRKFAHCKGNQIPSFFHDKYKVLFICKIIMFKYIYRKEKYYLKEKNS